MDIDNGLEKSSILDDSGVMVIETNDSNVSNGTKSVRDPDRGGTGNGLSLKDDSKSSSAVPCLGEPICAPQEQFILLAKSAKGAAAVQLIKEALEAPGLYVFAELLEMPNIKELSSSTEHGDYYRLMEVFAYGIYDDYLQHKDTLPTLSTLMLTKLRHLTLVTLASKQKSLPLDTLINKLSLNSRRELEDLIIEAVYADVVHGKLDQKNGTLEVDYTIGRDIKNEDLPDIAATLRGWCDSCTGLLGTLDALAERANKEKETNLLRTTNIDQEITRIKSNFKRQGISGGDDSEEFLSQTEKMEKKIRMKKVSQSGGSSSSKSKFWAKS